MALLKGTGGLLKTLLSRKYADLDYDNSLAVMEFVSDSVKMFRQHISPLQAAVSLGHLHICKYLLEEGVPPSCFSSSPNPLCVALRNGNEEIASLLLKAGANVNMALDDLLPMHFAIENANCAVEIVQSIIDAGFSKDSPVNNVGHTALHCAVDKNNIEIVSYLLSISANPNAVDEKGHTPVHMAVNNNNIALVRLLSSHEADLDRENSSGFTPLMSAMAADNLEMMRLLIDLGADIHYATSSKICSFMPLHFAANICDLKAVNLLLERGVDVNRKVELTGEIALHSAARAVFKGDSVKQSTALNCIVHLLIENGSDLTMLQNNGLTPLQVAVLSKNVKVATKLVMAFSELNDVLPDVEGESLTTFHYVASLLDKKLIELCINYGADCNSDGGKGKYPCHMALIAMMKEGSIHTIKCNKACICKTMIYILKLFWRNGFPFELTQQIEWLKTTHRVLPPFVTSELVITNSLLNGIKEQNIATVVRSLSSGAEPRVCSLKMRYPLHYIARTGHAAMLKVFCNQRVNVNCVDDNGETPLHIVARYSQGYCCQILLEAGAVYNYTSDECPQTPLEIAKSCGNTDAERVLQCVHNFFNTLIAEKSVKRLYLDKSMFKKPTLMCCGQDGETLIGKALELGALEEATYLMNMK